MPMARPRQRKTVQSAPPHQARQLLLSANPPPIHLTRWAAQRLLPSQPRLSTDPAGKQRWHGLGQHGLWRVSQARHTLVWKNQTREVHDRSRRPKSQLSRGGSGCAEKEIELVDLCVASSRLQVLIFSLLLFSQDDFAVAHELIVQPQTVLVRGRFATGARRAAEQPHAGRRLKNVR